MLSIRKNKYIKRIISILLIIFISKSFIGFYNSYAEESIDENKNSNNSKKRYPVTQTFFIADKDQTNDAFKETIDEKAGYNVGEKAYKPDEGKDNGIHFGLLYEPIIWLVRGMGDTFNWLIQEFIAGEEQPIVGKAPYNEGKQILEMNGLTQSQALSEKSKKRFGIPIPINTDYIDTKWDGNYWIPNILITPVEIFGGKVSAFDANLFKKRTDYSNAIGGENKSIINDMQRTIASWYTSIRNFSTILLMSVLLYMGIRIVISSNNNEKARYKQFMGDWIVALCLLFFLHYIMSFEMGLSGYITDIFAGDEEQLKEKTVKQVIVQLINKNSGGSQYFTTNFVGLARMKSEYDNTILSMGYSIIYFGFTTYTVYFSVRYIKRLLMLSFYTIISPIIAITYPIDKMKDSRAQSFNTWLKQYTFYAFLQPLHMLLYRIFVGSTNSIAKENLIFALVALSFIVPAEKIIKQLLNIKGVKESSGGFAGGLFASKAFNALNMKNKNEDTNAKMPSQIRTVNNPNVNAIGEGFSNNSIGMRNMMANDFQLESGFLSNNQNLLNQNVNSNNYQNNLSGKQTLEKDNKNNVQKNDNDFNESQQKNNQFNEKQDNKKENDNNNNMENMMAGQDFRQQSQEEKLKDINAEKNNINNKDDVEKNQNNNNNLENNENKLENDNHMNFQFEDKSVDIVNDQEYNKDELKEQSNDNQNKEFNQVESIGQTYEDFEKDYLNNSEVKTRFMENNPDMSLEEIQDELKSEAKMIYDTGLTDYSSVKSAVEMEKSGEYSHDYIVSAAQLSRNYDNSLFTDESNKKLLKAQETLQKDLETKIEKELKHKLSKQEKNKISEKAGEEAERAMQTIKKIKKAGN